MTYKSFDMQKRPDGVTFEQFKKWVEVHVPRLVVRVRLGLTGLTRWRDAFLEWRKREKLRAELDALSVRELLDIGIARGEIDYIASNRASDPRSAVFPERSRSMK
jgi:uncharacterized protein YjiS (DUF1127 family)